MSGPEGTRTPDPLHAMQVRYQLRHRPVMKPSAYYSVSGELAPDSGGETAGKSISGESRHKRSN